MLCGGVRHPDRESEASTVARTANLREPGHIETTAYLKKLSAVDSLSPGVATNTPLNSSGRGDVPRMLGSTGAAPATLDLQFLQLTRASWPPSRYGDAAA